MRIPALALIAIVAAGSAVQAQSLADVARKEAERRKTDKTGGRVYTNKDLKPVAPPPAAVDSAAPAPATSGDKAAAADSAAAGEKPKTEERGEKWWSNRVRDARERLDRDRVLADAMQSRINALTTDFVNRDDPAQRAVIGRDRDRAMAELARLQQAVDTDAKAIKAIEEEARQAGIPPGWIR